MQKNISFDPAWQNEDGTVKSLSRAELRALSPDQRRARELAQGRQYARRARTSRLNGREREAEIEARRTRSEQLRARREQEAAQTRERGRIESERRVRSLNHPAFPPPPGASLDQEWRLRVVRAQAAGRRPTHGYF